MAEEQSMSVERFADEVEEGSGWVGASRGEYEVVVEYDADVLYPVFGLRWDDEAKRMVIRLESV